MSEYKPVYLLPVVRNVDSSYSLQELMGNDWGLQMFAEALAVADALGIDVELSEGIIGEAGGQLTERD